MPPSYFLLPTFYGRNYENSTENPMPQTSAVSKTDYPLQNKYIYILGLDYNNDMNIVHEIKTDNEGKISSKTHLPVRKDYYFYVSDKQIENYRNIKRDYCSNNISTNDNIEQEIILYPGICVIGADTKDVAMNVRIYGKGAQKGAWPIRNIQKAIFFIGRLHGDELAAEYAIQIMETYLQQYHYDIPPNTTIFILNPVHSTLTRNIPNDNGINPNRDFLSLKLRETQAINNFVRSIESAYDDIIIISAHSYNINNPQNRWRREAGCVFPLYKIIPEGKFELSPVSKSIKIGESVFSVFVGIEQPNIMIQNNTIIIPGANYISPSFSQKIAHEFSKCTGFGYESMWRVMYDETGKPIHEMYEGELMYYLNKTFPDKIGNKINMIEFELPSSLELELKNAITIKSEWYGKFTKFLNFLIKGDMIK
jgi:hypothetical protein